MRCEECDKCEGYYRYKTASHGRNRLVTYYCKHEEGNDKGRHGLGIICMSRDGVEDKVKTSPRWCPLKQKQ